jgi:hypothetical protein
MSNTDHLACIHVYHYNDPRAAPRPFLNDGPVLLRLKWKRFRCSWGEAAAEAAARCVAPLAASGALFRVAHACGNHVQQFGHGGAVAFVFYWSAPPVLHDAPGFTPAFAPAALPGADEDWKGM